MKTAVKIDLMEHLSYMEAIESGLMDKVFRETNEYLRRNYSVRDVKSALQKDVLSTYDYGALLSPAAESLLEEIAKRAKAETRKHFGNSVSLYTPLYIANYCENHCTYCGFNSKNKIMRGKLAAEEISREMEAISQTGLKDILLLTGESRALSSVEYIGEAIKIAREYFSTIGIEIYPLNTDEYAYLHQCGADFVSVYQETYDLQIYDKHHVSGPKRAFLYRFNSQERAFRGGMRGVAFGSLLGLGEFRRDAYSTGVHAYYMQQKYPHGEIAFSAPRIRTFKNSSDDGEIGDFRVNERQLLQVLMAYRVFMPFATITISTRERAGFRDNVIGLAVNRMSAGVKVGVGGHSADEKGDEQFVISDPRSVDQMHMMILEQGLQPVYADNIHL